MPFEVKLPDIGEGVAEGEIVRWLVKPGDAVREDQPLVEVMTDKALVEITAPEAGRITRLYVPKGEIAKVHAPLFAYQAEGEASAGEASPTVGTKEPAGGSAAGEAVSAAAPKDFILPDIGEGIVECEVVEWRVAEGERIAEDQPLVDVMTDKALVEITAPEAGTVSKLYVPKGDIAKVHAPLFAYVPAYVETGDEQAASSGSVRPTRQAEESEITPVASGGRGPYGRIPASPAVRRLVREHGVALDRMGDAHAQLIDRSQIVHCSSAANTGISSRVIARPLA